MNNGLFHYCSNQSLLEIIRSKTLLLTIVTAANDSEETMRVRPIILEMSANASDDQKQWYEQLLNTFDINMQFPFIGCFSENGDQLSQWRGYADGAAGVSIEFDMQALGMREVLPLSHLSHEFTIGLAKVIYNAEEHRTKVESIIKSRLERSKNTQEATMAMEAAIELRQLSFICKDNGFHEEVEWRIIHTPPFLESNGIFQFHSAVGVVSSRIKGTQIVTSVSLPITNDSLLSVTTGPKNPTHHYDLYALLKCNGFVSAKVNRSTIGYR